MGRPRRLGSTALCLALRRDALWVRHRLRRRSPARHVPAAAACPRVSPAASFPGRHRARVRARHLPRGLRPRTTAATTTSAASRSSGTTSTRPSPSTSVARSSRTSPSSSATVGIHTHGDGVMHIHPFSQLGVGANATLGRYLKDARDEGGLEVCLSNSKLDYLGDDTKEGDTKCDGVKDPILRLAYWDDVPDEPRQAGGHHRRLQRRADHRRRRWHHGLLRRPQCRHPAAGDRRQARRARCQRTAATPPDSDGTSTTAPPTAPPPRCPPTAPAPRRRPTRPLHHHRRSLGSAVQAVVLVGRLRHPAASAHAHHAQADAAGGQPADDRARARAPGRPRGRRGPPSPSATGPTPSPTPTRTDAAPAWSCTTRWSPSHATPPARSGSPPHDAGIAERFVVVNGDVLTDLDSPRLVARHDAAGAEGTLALHRVADPSAFGVVPTEADGRVIGFVEKPPPGEAPTDLINAGTYVLEPSVLDRIAAGVPVNVERVTFPAMVADGSALRVRRRLVLDRRGDPGHLPPGQPRPPRRHARARPSAASHPTRLGGRQGHAVVGRRRRAGGRGRRGRGFGAAARRARSVQARWCELDRRRRSSVRVRSPSNADVVLGDDARSRGRVLSGRVPEAPGEGARHRRRRLHRLHARRPAAGRGAQRRRGRRPVQRRPWPTWPRPAPTATTSSRSTRSTSAGVGGRPDRPARARGGLPPRRAGRRAGVRGPSRPRRRASTSSAASTCSRALARPAPARSCSPPAAAPSTASRTRRELPVKESHPQQPLSPYGVAKRVVTDYLNAYRELYELEYTSLALANVYGPRQDPHGEAGVVAIFAGLLLAGKAVHDLRRRRPDPRLRLRRRRGRRLRAGRRPGQRPAVQHRHRRRDLGQRALRHDGRRRPACRASPPGPGPPRRAGPQRPRPRSGQAPPRLGARGPTCATGVAEVLAYFRG